ncbi:hypothetical protein RFI_39611 [Reticulomyxa filosa]|uniref:Uncharacterized protein n=1 Tax=Reticulomyxa filosa TaxID=46433 RepID=X6L9B2_RETFI|nr:hypothetical protein RFI_39611 [Reticulomyxa filosa]|eukprot:ETN97915.1 hypothetical protein RFI_39611 [Reticulomyxa filosa]
MYLSTIVEAVRTCGNTFKSIDESKLKLAFDLHSAHKPMPQHTKFFFQTDLNNCHAVKPLKRKKKVEHAFSYINCACNPSSFLSRHCLYYLLVSFCYTYFFLSSTRDPFFARNGGKINYYFAQSYALSFRFKILKFRNFFYDDYNLIKLSNELEENIKRNTKTTTIRTQKTKFFSQNIRGQVLNTCDQKCH